MSYLNMAQLEKSLDKIRNILRSEGITGMDSVNHCIIYMFSRLLDTRTCKKIGIDKSFAFKNIRKHSNGEEIGREEFICKIYNGNNKDTFYYMLHVKIGFNEMRYKQKDAYNLEQIYDELEKINVKDLSTKFDMIGTIYELHLRSGTSNSMRDLGQYYTHRLVIKYMVELCKPKVTDGLIDRIIDPTMGTGGFLTMATKYLNNKYDDIDWKMNKERIIGFDIDAHVKNMALLNLLLEIHYLPDKTLNLRNTLQKDLDCEGIKEYDVILANEPMGLKNIKYDDCSDKIKELKIKGNKAEPLFLLSFMQHLAEKGRCAVIIPDGVIFNESAFYKKTREYLIENFNLKKVITLNDDNFFINTGVKTSILFFKNTGKTKEVEFSEIKIKDDNIDEISIMKVKYNTIVKENYTLFVNRYICKKVKKIEGIEYKKLDDICNFLSTSKNISEKGSKTGKYRYYNSSQKDRLYVDTFEVNKESLIVGNGGNLCVHYDIKFTPTKHVTVCQNNEKYKINMKYVYYYVYQNNHLLTQKSAGSTIKWLNKKNLGSIEIPIPSLETQNNIIEKLDLLEKNIKTNEKNIMEYKSIMKNDIDVKIAKDIETKNINDICKFLKKSKRKASFGKDEGEYNFYTSSSKVQKCDVNDYNEECIIIGTGGNANIKLGKNFSCSSDNFILNSKKETVTTMFIYYYLYNNIHIIENGFKGSTIKHVSKSYLEKIEIPIPSLEKQKKIVEQCDYNTMMIENMKKIIEERKISMKEHLELLSDNKKETKKVTKKNNEVII